VTDTSGQSSSLAQLLALIGGGSQQGMPGGAPMQQPMAPLPWQGQQQQRPLLQPYQMPTGPGMPGSPMPQIQGPGGTGMGGGHPNIMAMLQSLDPATRMKLMMQLGLIPPQQGNPLAGINSSPNPMPGMTGNANAPVTGTRG
jgi:hypothetical protein